VKKLIFEILRLIVSGICGFGGGIIAHRFQERYNAEKLRKAVKAEINSMSIFDSMERIKERETHVKHNVFPTTAYTTNAGHLGLLSEEEREKIVSFYEAVFMYNGLLEQLRHEEMKEAKGIEIGTTKKALNGCLKTLRKRRDKLLKLLEEKEKSGSQLSSTSSP